MLPTTSTCPFTGAPASLPNSNLLDMVYCALYGAVDAIKIQPQLLGQTEHRADVRRLGLEQGRRNSTYRRSSPYNPLPMDQRRNSAFENAINAGIPKATGNAKLDGDMTEAWAWFTGNTGPRSGTSYSAHIGTLSLPEELHHPDRRGGKQGRPCNGSGCGATSDLTTAGWTAAQQVHDQHDQLSAPNTGTTARGSTNGRATSTRRFQQQRERSRRTSSPTRSRRVGHTVRTRLHAGAAKHGEPGRRQGVRRRRLHLDRAGAARRSSTKSRPSTACSRRRACRSARTPREPTRTRSTSACSVPTATTIRAGWAISSSTSSASAGTAEQPDAVPGGRDRHGGDQRARTGFITPTAVELLDQQGHDQAPGQHFRDRRLLGEQSAKRGRGFDSPDGEIVEKGGVGQQIRLANLQDNYTTSPSSPRNVYTCTGTCTDTAAACPRRRSRRRMPT